MNNKVSEHFKGTREIGEYSTPTDSNTLTIMEVFSRLEQQCIQLKEITDLTEKLKMRLYGEYEEYTNKERVNKSEIVEDLSSLTIPQLFDRISNRLEIEMDRITGITNRSIDIIG